MLATFSDAQDDWYGFLLELCRKKENIVSENFLVEISENGCQEEAIIIKITSLKDQNLIDSYVLDKRGVFEMSFVYPPIVPVPAADIDLPASMSWKERLALGRERARRVYDFVRAVREGRS